MIDEFDNISNIISKWLQKWKTPLKFQKTDNTNRLIESLGSDFRKTQENFNFGGYLNNKLAKQEKK